jgi:hypothetical protein
VASRQPYFYSVLFGFPSLGNPIFSRSSNNSRQTKGQCKTFYRQNKGSAQCVLWVAIRCFELLDQLCGLDQPCRLTTSDPVNLGSIHSCPPHHTVILYQKKRSVVAPTRNVRSGRDWPIVYINEDVYYHLTRWLLPPHEPGESARFSGPVIRFKTGGSGPSPTEALIRNRSKPRLSLDRRRGTNPKK